ncbi:manganese efflux pump MntP [Corynebacterium glyciniphilum]|uniref:manganese efflux pump MntP n=1 Tax=Corynebacterium glyciniphilum TaxID=1404244 RepID=UPI003FD63D00
MSLLAVFGIGVGLSGDAFAAALTHGVKMRRMIYRHALVIALTFAGFQAAMPLLGWLLASQFTRLLNPIDHWIAFGLLFLIGAKMIWDACRTEAEHDAGDNGLKIGRLLMLGIATSIDAAAVGVSFAVLEISILQSILIIGATTLVLSFVAVLVGHRIGVRFRTPAEIIGGLVLIAIGTRILLEDVGIF